LTNSEIKIGNKCPPWGIPDVDEKMFDLMPNNILPTVACSSKKGQTMRAEILQNQMLQRFSVKLNGFIVSNALAKFV